MKNLTNRPHYQSHEVIDALRAIGCEVRIHLNSCTVRYPGEKGKPRWYFFHGNPTVIRKTDSNTQGTLWEWCEAFVPDIQISLPDPDKAKSPFAEFLDYGK